MLFLGQQTKNRSQSVVLASDAVIENTNAEPIFHDTFNTFDTTNNWTVVNKATKDILLIDGNSLASDFLSMALDPLAENTETIIESKAIFNKPDKNLFLVSSASQRVAGQEFSYSLVSTEASAPAYTPVAIASISQTATTLSVTTATAHGLNVSDRISISDVPDSRLNYCWIVVATVTSPTTFTVTAGNIGNLPSVTSSVFNTGFVHYRPVLDLIPNGVAVFAENATATNSSCFVKNGASSFFPSGTIAGNHGITVSTNASVNSIANQYNIINFQASTISNLSVSEDIVSYNDRTLNATNANFNTRFKSESVIPNSKLDYKIRFKIKNNKSFTRPIAQIVSATKTGTTTATIITDVNHGLTTTDVVNIYGLRDQTNFPNLTSATAVASIVNSTTFTIVIGPASTSTSYGGYVSRVNGGQNQGGAIAQSIQSVVRTSNLLTLVGSGNWAGFVVGDYVNIVGCRNISTGASLSIDGSYKVIYFTTTSLTLKPIADYAPTGADITLTNCGGGVIKLSVFRLHNLSMRQNIKNLVEILPSALQKNDIAQSSAVSVLSQPSISFASNQTIETVTTLTAGNLHFPQLIADQASSAITSTTTSSTITPTFGNSYFVNYVVSTSSGTNQTLDVVIQESDDGGTTWFDVYHFPRITGITNLRSPKLFFSGNRVRYVQTIGGISPLFTRSINRFQCSDSLYNNIRQIFDRTISLTTLNATTLPIINHNAENAQLAINIGTATTAPILQLQGSLDNLNWFALGNTLTAVASSTVITTVNNIHAPFIRARVSTAGATVVAGYVLIKTF